MSAFAHAVRRITVPVILSLAAMTLTGCVGQGEYDNLYTANRSLTARNAELQRERDEARAALELLKKSMGSGEGALAALQKENAELRRLYDKALADYKDLDARMAGLDFGRLDPTTDQALEALAKQYPGLMTYDPNTGMLRFASDLTFDSGSDAVKDEAKRALSALAEVLKSSSALQYEIIVEGHTDSQRVSANTQKRHATNRHLSAHRAISVIDVLGNMGVPYGRMMAAGWGEYRPLVTNAPNGNTPQNRRVEIFLAKGHSTGSATADVAAPAPSPTKATPDRSKPPAKPIDLTK
ncbi:MAG: OmpA family protein [Planctomycetes bacterium]|nr:OmpA family protein [Planctomycetota bacterium]